MKKRPKVDPKRAVRSVETVDRMLSRLDAHEVNARSRGGVPQARNFGSYSARETGGL